MELLLHLIIIILSKMIVIFIYYLYLICNRLAKNKSLKFNVSNLAFAVTLVSIKFFSYRKIIPYSYKYQRVMYLLLYTYTTRYINLNICIPKKVI